MTTYGRPDGPVFTGRRWTITGPSSANRASGTWVRSWEATTRRLGVPNGWPRRQNTGVKMGQNWGSSTSPHRRPHAIPGRVWGSSRPRRMVAPPSRLETRTQLAPTDIFSYTQKPAPRRRPRRPGVRRSMGNTPCKSVQVRWSCSDVRLDGPNCVFPQTRLAPRPAVRHSQAARSGLP